MRVINAGVLVKLLIQSSILENAINMEAKHIAKNIKLDNRIKSLAKAPASIAVKDHKGNVRTCHPSPLIKPSKRAFEKVSKALEVKIWKIL